MKIIKRLFILMFIILLTGCVDAKYTMNITKDNVDYEMIIGMQEKSLPSDEDLFSEEDKKNYEDLGYKIETYNKDGYVYYKFNKSLGSLDSLSSSKGNSVNLEQLLSGDFKDITLFKKSLIFYEATFVTLKNNVVEDTAKETEETDENKTLEETEKNYDFTALNGIATATFKVNLPAKTISNNARKVTNNGKTLEWDLTKDTLIKFKFTPYMDIITYIVIALIGIIVISVILTIIKAFRRGPKATNHVFKNNFSTSNNTQNIIDNNINNNVNTDTQINNVEVQLDIPSNDINQINSIQQNNNAGISFENIPVNNVEVQPSIPSIDTSINQIDNVQPINTEIQNNPINNISNNDNQTNNMVPPIVNNDINQESVPSVNTIDTQSNINNTINNQVSSVENDGEDLFNSIQPKE